MLKNNILDLDSLYKEDAETIVKILCRNEMEKQEIQNDKKYNDIDLIYKFFKNENYYGDEKIRKVIDLMKKGMNFR